MTDEQALRVYSHYNPSNLSLVAVSSIRGSMMFEGNIDGPEKIQINLGNNVKNLACDNIFAVKSLFDHEAGGHYRDYLKFGHVRYDQMGRKTREERALNYQIPTAA